ncbi:MAG: DUF5723 family protein, partial [Bacteroidota bacterium]
LIFRTAGYSQELLGVVNSTTSGVNSPLINPAGMADSRFWLDINILTLDVFAENNMVYMSKNDYYFTKLFKDNNYTTDRENRDGTMIFDKYNSKNKKLYSSIRLQGPEFMMSLGRHSFALIDGIRFATSMKGLPFHVAKLAYEGTDYAPLQNKTYTADKFRWAAAGWGEIGLSYSYIIKHEKTKLIAVGASVKKLFGIYGGYLNNNKFTYNVLNDSVMQIDNLNASFGYGGPFDYAGGGTGGGKLFSGRGWGFDLGFVLMNKPSVGYNGFHKPCSQTYRDYDWKLGVSILDIGGIKFKSNAAKYSFNDVSTIWNGIDTFKYRNQTQINNEMNYHFGTGSPDQFLAGNNISIGLPTALSIQYDYRYTKNWYFNGTIVYPLHFSKTGIRRASQFAFTPRYERKKWEVNLPVSVYDMQSLRMGLAVRVLSVTVGTEKLSPFLGTKDFTGLDLYVAVKVSFDKGKCRQGKGWNPVRRLFNKRSILYKIFVKPFSIFKSKKKFRCKKFGK